MQNELALKKSQRKYFFVQHMVKPHNLSPRDVVDINEAISGRTSLDTEWWRESGSGCPRSTARGVWKAGDAATALTGFCEASAALGHKLRGWMEPKSDPNASPSLHL